MGHGRGGLGQRLGLARGPQAGNEGTIGGSSSSPNILSTYLGSLVLTPVILPTHIHFYDSYIIFLKD